MSYQVLARKWRPKSFDTLVGQEHVVRALTHALEQQRLHHAYLFTGTRGVGKTTIARILAKALNCEKGITATPCGECAACREIDAGRFIDYVEMDAASNRGVEDMAALLEKAAYAPNSGRYKVYMIDEVHQLSGHAFNAMLKTLEEPPEHVKFILATTDPQKIPVTVLSRCLQFNLKQMPPSLIVEHLGGVLAAEGVSFEAGALRQIAKAAAGSMRDALSLLDQAIAHGAGRIEAEGAGGVRAMLGTVGDDHLYALLEGLAAGDIHAMLAVADVMEARTLSFESALQELATLFHRIALVQFAPNAVLDEAEREKLAPYAERLDPEFLQLCYQIVTHGRDELVLAPDEAAGFGMALLRMHAFRPASGHGGHETPVVAKVGAGRTAPLPVKTPQTAPPLAPAAAPPESARVQRIQLAPAAMTDESDWHTLVAQLPLTGMARQLAQHCELASQDDANIVLHMAPAHKHLQVHQEKLRADLVKHYGRRIALEIRLTEPAGETPKTRADNEKRERQDRAIAAIEGDPFVREACDLFDASIDESTIKPI